ncbi:phytanoyl-CoA dioxygenase family protein [Moorena producens]|uniref:phytanoyl-CoA dioxygenase family protein n=1 Tax=Moorena producens TaxID=1155739 RepID=UPI003C757050
MINNSNVETNKEKICTTRPLSKEQIAQYHDEGFLIVPSFFDPEEVAPIKQALQPDSELSGIWTQYVDNHGTTWMDSHGHLNQQLAWIELGDSLLSVIPRTVRMVNAVEVLLGGLESYHWHSKITVKNPHTQAWIEWHQGYGGWYNDGCLYPDFVTSTVAIDKNTKENGCLQVIKKSHLMGRLDHKVFDGGGGALRIDSEWMDTIIDRLGIVYCELEPGDALFIHANTIHCSGDNQTDLPRTTLTCHYNARSNEPFCLERVPHRRYRFLERLPDTSIIEKNYSSVLNSQVFMKKTFDKIITYGMEPEK